MPKESLEVFATSSYWDTRYVQQQKESNVYSSEGAVGYEWFQSFEKLQKFLSRHLPPASKGPKLLQLGCGDSTLTADLHRHGYHSQVSIDFSAVVIDNMKTKYKKLNTKWKVMDVRALDFSKNEFDIAIDKGTLDSFLHGSLWSPPPDVLRNVQQYVNEVARVLKPGGKWLYVTYRQPHFMTPMLAKENVWTLKVESLAEKPGGNGTFEYFGYIMEKHRK